MSARRLTRRSFLLAGAGALAGGLHRPGGSLALGLASAHPRLSERFLGAVAPRGRVISLQAGADLLGLEWQAPAGARVELRLKGSAGHWSRWVSAAGCASCEQGPAAAGASGRLIGAPVWSAGASAIELRATRALEGVRLHTVDVSGGAGARRLALARGLVGSASAFSGPAPLPAVGAGQPPILARAAWGQGMARARVAPAYGAVRMAFVHHTETPNGYLAGEVPAMLRAIFLYHRDVKGWNDIGYNFVIDAFGRIFEARAGGIDEPVVGAQAGGFNLVSTGVAVLGAFSRDRIPLPAAQALQALLAWKLSLHGVAPKGRALVRVNPAGAIYSRFPGAAHVWLPHIAGHRDGDSTDCPGDALYRQLGALKEGVRLLAPDAARATLALGGRSAAPPGPGAPQRPPAGEAGAQLTGTLKLLDGAPIVGAQIELQLRSAARRGEAARERTIAVARTDGAGSWSLPAAPAGHARGEEWLRALYAGGAGQPGSGRAAISDPLLLPARVIHSLQALPPNQAASAPPSP